MEKVNIKCEDIKKISEVASVVIKAVQYMFPSEVVVDKPTFSMDMKMVPDTQTLEVKMTYTSEKSAVKFFEK